MSLTDRPTATFRLYAEKGRGYGAWVRLNLTQNAPEGFREWCDQLDSVVHTETRSPREFTLWLETVAQEYNAQAAASVIISVVAGYLGYSFEVDDQGMHTIDDYSFDEGCWVVGNRRADRNELGLAQPPGAGEEFIQIDVDTVVTPDRLRAMANDWHPPGQLLPMGRTVYVPEGNPAVDARQRAEWRRQQRRWSWFYLRELLRQLVRRRS